MPSGDIMNMVNAVWPFILMAAIFYFLLWRPQKKEQQRHQRMLDALKKGDKVITAGGIYGKIKEISDNYMSIEIAEGVNIRVDKTSIFASAEDAQQK